MRKLLLSMLAALLSLAIGCTTLVGSTNHYPRLQEARTKEVGPKGGSSSASKAPVRRSITASRAEALFRQAMFSLEPDLEAPGSAKSVKLLKRLHREYPESPWSEQAVPVMELINIANQLIEQNKRLKAANDTLTKENNTLTKENNTLTKENVQLNTSLRQLKSLDLELEHKSR